MDLITNKDDLIANIITLEDYIHSEDPAEREFARDVVRKGETLVIYKVDGVNHFAPSHFVGYKENTMDKYKSNEEEAGREADSIIDKLLKTASFYNASTDTKYLTYVEGLGVQAENNQRKYWRLWEAKGKYFDLEAYR